MSWRELSDIELAEQLMITEHLYDKWTEETERLRLGRLKKLDEAYANANRWHARLNGLLAEQKRRAA